MLTRLSSFARRPRPLATTLLLALALATARPARAQAPADSSATPTAPTRPAPRVRAWQVGLLRADRLQHASLSFTLAAGIGLAGRPRAEALGITLALGVLKELRDARSDRFDPADLAADATGAALGALAGAKR